MVPDDKKTIEILDGLRIGRGSSGKGGCWCWKADPTKTGPAFEEHTPTCVRTLEFYERIGGKQRPDKRVANSKAKTPDTPDKTEGD